MNPIHEKALDLYKKYLVLGGMPAIIKNFIENDLNISHVNFELQDEIIISYLAERNLLEKIILLNIVLYLRMLVKLDMKVVLIGY